MREVPARLLQRDADALTAAKFEFPDPVSVADGTLRV
jgi:hypothetical protein